ncbi:MAG: hypothetical protein OEZ48_00140 [Candidatus Bathyarchaeota archaeon]|nr:hypothetical protein [Candidatus Bathyarchaeota archaeon]MDH5686265.1 hypothetical protein [Candidatus Bathyarchaeota archaeon]
MKDELSPRDEWAVKWLARESGVPEEEMRKRIMSLPVDKQDVTE